MAYPVGMNDERSPSVATVIPVYNEVKHIEACLHGLLHQTLAPTEHMILVLDGGSSDGTVAKVEEDSVGSKSTALQNSSLQTHRMEKTGAAHHLYSRQPQEVAEKS